MLLTVAAATVGAQEAASEAGGGMSLWEILESGGLVMIVLGVISAIALALVFYYFFALRREGIVPGGLVEEARAAADRGDFGALTAACEAYPSPTADILGTGLERSRVRGMLDAGLFRDAIEAEGARQVASLRQQIRYLHDISVVSPMIGLLGTVIGMIRSFIRVDPRIGGLTLSETVVEGNPLGLAGGVSQALITTASGLVVAIPAMILFSYFRGKVSRLTAEMEAVCGEIAARLRGARG
jgi:biopolymer transport protein ExbB